MEWLGYLEPLFDDGVTGERLEDLEGEIDAAGTLVRLLGLLVLALLDQELGVGQVERGTDLRVLGEGYRNQAKNLFGEEEAVVPLLEGDVEFDEQLDVAEPQIGLLGEAVVALLFEVLSAEEDEVLLGLAVESFAQLVEWVQ
jgi:hypothetical protein